MSDYLLTYLSIYIFGGIISRYSDSVGGAEIAKFQTNDGNYLARIDWLQAISWRGGGGVGNLLARVNDLWEKLTSFFSLMEKEPNKEKKMKHEIRL